jgi:energy-converting hydrogenase A subunit M
MSDLNERRRLREAQQLALRAELLAGRAVIDELFARRATLLLDEVDRFIDLVRKHIRDLSACYGVRLVPERAPEANESELDFLLNELSSLEEMISFLPS